MSSASLKSVPSYNSKQSSRQRLSTLLRGIGTAVPQHSAPQMQACAFMERVLKASAGMDSAPLGLLRRIYSHSGIETRYSVLPDYTKEDCSEFEFFPKNWALDPFPSTAARMAQYETSAVELAAEAALEAISESQIHADKITHLVISTCTGFFAPGPDVLLAMRLGLNPNIKRTVLGFMGCYAGLSGLRVCHEIAQSDPDAVILQVAIELCSLHYQKDPSPDTLVANALFSDGAAAAVYSSRGHLAADDNPAIAAIAATHSGISPDSTDSMSWRIGDTGFVMRLNANVPQILGQAAPAFAGNLAAAAGLDVNDLDGWAIHPGGRKIVEAIQQSLDLPDESIASSSEILRDYGNMSSATILFVLKRELSKPGGIRGPVAAMAFGPGLTMEGALLVPA